MKQLIKQMAAAGLLALGAFSAYAAEIDLRTVVGTSGNDGTVVFTTVMEQPAGTGFIDPFVQVQHGGTEQAYNTTENNVYDNGSANNFNREIQVKQVGFIDTNGNAPGGQVMRFFLDLNESANTGDLDLDEIQLFISTDANQNIDPPLAQGQVVPLANSTLVYQMDAGGDDKVLLNYNLNGGGSGKGDMYMDVPFALFQAAFLAGGALYDTVAEQNNAYIYLYSRFSSADAGFEEWTYKVGSPVGQVPEPLTIGLLGIGLLGMSAVRRRRA